MRALFNGAGTGFVAVALALPVWAGETTFDAGLAYFARDEITLPHGTEESDNDILRLTTAISWSAGDGRMRAALELGVRNEDFNGSYPAVTGGELVFARKVGDQRYGIGARLRSAEDLSTTTELGYSAEHLGQRFEARGFMGLQYVADPDVVRGREDTGVFGQVDTSLYLSDNWVLDAGLLADTDGEVYGVGSEYRFGGSSFSVYMDYAEAYNSYRGVESYDTLSAGIRFVPGTKTLRAARQSNLNRVMYRMVEVQ
ncbi:MAG: hypothetical protein KDA50_12135 [Rhodobacteraceae bacterium]|nr:hypothetical protein [Paracoccaceae bacterium]